MEPRQGFRANLITSLLVAFASRFGFPVSTTHVSCGSLFGIGAVRRREAHWLQVAQILIAWLVTLPCGVFLAGLFAHVSGRAH